MRKEEKNILELAPRYAFGSRSKPPLVEENMSVLCELELVDFLYPEPEREQVSDKDVMDKILKDYEEGKSPLNKDAPIRNPVVHFCPILNTAH